MKFLIALTLLTASVVQAQTTVTLMACGGAGALHQYHECPTDVVPADPITIYLPQSTATGGMTLWFDSEAVNQAPGTNYHWTGIYNGVGVASTLQQYECTGPLVNMGGYYAQVCALTGASMTLLIYESSRLVRGSGSGRGGYASHRVWTLTGGTITFN